MTDLEPKWTFDRLDLCQKNCLRRLRVLEAEIAKMRSEFIVLISAAAALAKRRLSAGCKMLGFEPLHKA
jgi:hypothetical protein